MEIAIFESVVIESALIELEAESKKYDGLYVDMDKAPERKYVKDKAALIAGLKKKVDRVRIDSAKDYKCEVESQALAIQARLDDANSNFQILIDDYAADRKVILDAEKARKQAIFDAEELENKHEIGLLMNDKYELDKIKAQQEKIEHEEKIKIEAIKAQKEQAEHDRITAEQRAAADKQALIDVEANAKLAAQQAEQRRLNDIETAKQGEIARVAEQRKFDEEEAQRKANDLNHVKQINNEALTDLIGLGLSENNAKAVISAIAKKQISHITINY